VRKAADCLEPQPPVTLKAYRRIALPSHLRSAVCRSSQFATSINNAVSQRGYRPACCVVDVDWLKVWVQLVGRGRNGDCTDGHLDRVVNVWIEMETAKMDT
jgi:hypothetical protein